MFLVYVNLSVIILLLVCIYYKLVCVISKLEEINSNIQSLPQSYGDLLCEDCLTDEELK